MNTMYKRLEELKIQCRQLKSVENQTRQNYEKVSNDNNRDCKIQTDARFLFR